MAPCKPRRVASLVLAATILAVAPPLFDAPTRVVQAQDKEKQDELDGAWQVKSLTRGIKEGGGPVAFRFKGKWVIISFPVIPMKDRTFKTGTFKTDPTKMPKQIEMTIEGGDAPALGIYKIEKGVLTLCFNEDTRGKRPTKFDAPAGSLNVLIVFERDKLDPAIEKLVERLAARAARSPIQKLSENNLKQIGWAMHGYHDTSKRLPANAIYSKDGKPLLSWRVAILPYLDHKALYEEFKLDEPWDSEHNKKLIAKMPKVFEVPGGAGNEHTTVYQVFTGPGTIFEGKDGIRLTGITDGTSNTAMVVEAAKAVTWTQPEDMPVEKGRDLPKVGGLFKGGFHLLMADGSVRFVNSDVAADTLRAIISRNGGEVINLP